MTAKKPEASCMRRTLPRLSAISRARTQGPSLKCTQQAKLGVPENKLVGEGGWASEGGGGWEHRDA